MSRLRTAVAVLLVIIGQSTALAQEPVPTPRDTVRVPADTTPEPPDTMAAPVIQDSVYPIPQLARPYFPPARGFIEGAWDVELDDLLLEATTSLSDLLERIPGVFTLRSGLIIQPEAAATFGGTAARLEVFVDGYQLDPLGEASIDPTKIELVNIERLRIERRIGLIRIFIETATARDNRPYTRIEAGVGEPNSNLFRGVLLAPKLFFGPLGVAVDRVDTDGFGRNEPGDQFAGWAKWSFIRGKSGFEVEYRRVSTDRDDAVPWPAEHTRDDLVGRLRINIADAVVAELFGGQSSFEGDTADPQQAEDTLPKIDESTLQYGGQLSFETPLLWARGSARFRDNEALASLQLDGSAGFRIGDFVSIAADVTRADWRDAGAVTWHALHGQLTPLPWLSVFGELTGGQRGAPYIYTDSAGAFIGGAFINELTGYRAGAQLSLAGITLGGALLHAEADSSAAFGLPFDSARARTSYPGFNVDGYEVNASVPLFLRGLTAYGMFTQWQSGTRGLYMPERQYRAGLQLHNSPLPSGNLELYGRIEAVHRGAMAVPFADLPADDTFDAYVQIRIIDVRMFARFEDITGQNASEVVGRTMLGPRIVYGVKWHFWN
ncbi:MAG TPA: hypothetical protein VFZ04_11795 [Longimicrobiales bacterium]